jgi:hypothetical protein
VAPDIVSTCANSHGTTWLGTIAEMLSMELSRLSFPDLRSSRLFRVVSIQLGIMMPTGTATTTKTTRITVIIEGLRNSRRNLSIFDSFG